MITSATARRIMPGAVFMDGDLEHPQCADQHAEPYQDAKAGVPRHGVVIDEPRVAVVVDELTVAGTVPGKEVGRPPPCGVLPSREIFRLSFALTAEAYLCHFLFPSSINARRSRSPGPPWGAGGVPLRRATSSSSRFTFAVSSATTDPSSNETRCLLPQ